MDKQRSRALITDESGELRMNWTVTVVLAVVFIGIGIPLMLGAFGGSQGRFVTLPLGIAFVLVPGVLIALALVIMRSQKRHRESMERGGIPATARLLSIDTTGSEFGVGNFGVKMVFEVTPSDGQPYELKKKMFLNVAEMGAFQPGAVFPILIDPKNRKKFIFGTARQAAGTSGAPASWGATTWGSAPGGEGQGQPQFLQGQQAAQLLQSLGLGGLAAAAGSASINIDPDASVADLLKAKASGGLPADSQVLYSLAPSGDVQAKIQEIISQSDYGVLADGETAESTILEVKDLGIRVAGNNPAVKMLIEVHPRERVAFKAEVSGFVTEASHHKLQVGRKLTVKFDPSDTTRVAIFHTGPEDGGENPRIIE